MTKGPLYVCCMCGQDFTRKYNASRHNRNIHFNKAEIVRGLEYLIGRISGKYLPPGDPLSYRMKNKNKNTITVVHKNDDNNFQQERSYSLPMETAQRPVEPRENRIDDENHTKFGKSIDSMKSVTNSADYLHYFNDLLQLSDKKARESSQKQKIQDQIRDIERMLYDFYPHERVQILVAELYDRYNSTADYTNFSRQLENYQNNLVNKYLGY